MRRIELNFQLFVFLASYENMKYKGKEAESYDLSSLITARVN